jgi:hypothetical protein
MEVLNDFMKSNIIDQKRRRYGIDEFVSKDDSTGVGDAKEKEMKHSFTSTIIIKLS